MTEINTGRRWPVVTAIIAAAAILLAVLLVKQPWAENPQIVATEIKSFRMISTITSTIGDEITESSYEMAYTAPDRYHMKKTSGGDLEEIITIGDEIYSREPEELGTNVQKAMAISLSRSTPSKENTVETLDSLTDLKELPEENIGGITCLHYRGRIDNESMVEEQKAKLDPSESHYEERLKALEQQLQIKVEVELWIGRDDYLIRQMKQDMQIPSKDTGKLDTSSSVIKYYDFNEPITIEPPLDAQGELVPGWSLVSDSSVSSTMEERIFSSNVLSTIGGEDPAHQRISFEISITNITEEAARNVRVTLSTMATNEAGDSLRMEAEPAVPIDLAPGESKTYYATWEYDAIHTSKEELSRLVDLTTILAKYTTPSGEEAVELLFPDAPYPSKKPPG